ncbi:uncharacterized protein L969DRAFT_16380 [Mixia osmundae IAM 14324]|nr:uncharacterized protein L969DRAFT_16380 [Mixia osmundae IAM 14324]KEI41027.1 hypothetical protein L969DRAFT_16380 [Mixia osmundae IAM 14324]
MKDVELAAPEGIASPYNTSGRAKRPPRRPQNKRADSSFLKTATYKDKYLVILEHSLKHGLLVGAGAHLVLSAIKLAGGLLSLVIALTSRSKRPTLIKIVSTSFADAATRRLAGTLALFSLIWTAAYPALQKFGLERDDESDSLIDRIVRSLGQQAAASAGFVAGLALLVQTRSERVAWAPQIFCRGLYSHLKARPLFHVPNADMLLFGCVNAQILLGMYVYPDTLEKGYRRWMDKTAQFDHGFLEAYRAGIRGSAPSTRHVELLEHSVMEHGHPEHVAAWARWKPTMHSCCVPCGLSHRAEPSCLRSNARVLLNAFLAAMPMYAPVHLLPALIFHGKQFTKAPVVSGQKISLKIARSCAFLASYVGLARSAVCWLDAAKSMSGSQISAGPWFAASGALTSATLLWEEPHRRAELALYCAPKALESLFFTLSGVGLAASVPFGEVLLACAGTAMLMDCYVHKVNAVQPLPRALIAQIADPHLPTSSAHRAHKERRDTTRELLG